MSLLEWLAADPERYTVTSDVPLFVFAALAVWGMATRAGGAKLATRAGTALMLALAACALLAARWPTLFVREPLNQDEAQALAQAITALHDPIPWLGFDGNTCGPLNTYVLTLPALVGAHLTFLSTRLIALALEFGAIASLYVAVAVCFDAGIARVALVPPAAFFALATQDHFVHYSGEHLSIVLAALSLALLCVAYRRGVAWSWLASAGAVTGMLPFAKLQSVPLAAAIVAVALSLVVLASPGGLRGRTLRAAAFLAGMAAPPLLIVGTAALGGSLRDFWISYILTSRAYILSQDEPLSFLTASADVDPLFDALILIAAAGAVALIARYRAITPRQRGAFAAALVVLLGALWTIFAPARGSLNYLLFAVVPATGAAAAGLAVVAAALRLRVAGFGRGLLAIGFVTASLAAMSAFDREAYPYLGALSDYRFGRPDAVSALIERFVRPGQRMAIWGWRPKYFVTTYTLLGTRDAISAYQYSPNYNPYYDYFRRRYIADFETRKPAGFLDAGADSFDFVHRVDGGYETFPELAALVRRDYRLAGTADGIRLFVRRD